MFKVGLTGGIGSGKTTVANLFAQLNVPIIDTDQIARAVVAPQTACWQAIVDHFSPAAGHSLFEPHTQQINRRYLRHIIFNDPAQKKWLENLLHPLIRAEVTKQVSVLSAAYCILVIPLLLENQYDYQLNRLLIIDAAPATQIQRVIERDQMSVEQVQQIISHQVSREQRLWAADDFIENKDMSVDKLRAAVFKLHQQYLQLAQKP